jgi:hypothetical protein
MLEAVSGNEALSLSIVEFGDNEDLNPPSANIRFEMFHKLVRLGRGQHTHPDLPGEHRAHLNHREMRDNNPALWFDEKRRHLGGTIFRTITLCKRA